MENQKLEKNFKFGIGLIGRYLEDNVTSKNIHEIKDIFWILYNYDRITKKEYDSFIQICNEIKR